MFKSELEKSFFVDMLANGIPVNEDISWEILFDEIKKYGNTLDLFDANFIDESNISITNLSAEPVISVRKESRGSSYKIILYANDRAAALENAHLIGKCLYMIVSISSVNGWLDIRPETIGSENSSSSSDSCEFDSDFV